MASRLPGLTQIEVALRGRAERHTDQPGRHVSAVDGEEDIRVHPRSFLELAGYCVTVAVDGHGDLRKFFSEPPDLVLLDVRMPAMDGWTLLSRIREVLEAPVIMLTPPPEQAALVSGVVRLFPNSPSSV